MTKTYLWSGALLLFTSLFASSPSAVCAVDDGNAQQPGPTLKRKYGRPELTLPDYVDDGNLYRNVKDMIALSSYIYEHAALLEEVDEVKSPWFQFWKQGRPKNEELHEALSAGKTVGQVLETCYENIEILQKKSGDVVDATKVIANDLDDDQDTDATRDSVILAINADEEDVDKSCVYAIIVNHKLKRVSIVFRGTSNMGDWGTDVLVTQKKVDNPAASLTGIPKLKIHSGFAKSILKDGRIDAILDEVKSHMQSLKGYRFFVTGHSLGGALATLFGFYAAADDDLAKMIYGPVSIFSVASPRVGGTAFQESHKILEQVGRLRHARTHNENDKVSRVPYLNGNYKHVGLEIRLRAKRLGLGPILDYPSFAQWVQVGSSFAETVLTSLDALRLHGCELARDRLKFSRELLENTTLEKEYRRLWGLDFAFPQA
mmetsp:Transcript_43207/g.65267  ORF Transcript_43207/g.65267 Transcript_43207/m.65267 type:complete len:431 (-) Transcript_43207:244-1536(-)